MSPDEGPFIAPFTYDVATSVWTMSAGLRALLGLRAHERPNTGRLLENVHPEDRERLREQFEHRLRCPGAYSFTYRLTNPDGRRAELRVVGNAVAAAGTVIRLEGFVLDITADIHHWQTDAVTASNTARAAIEQAKGALMVTFGVSADEAFAMLAGYSQHHNVKLRDVATYLAGAISDPLYFNADRPVESLLDVLALMNARTIHHFVSAFKVSAPDAANLSSVTPLTRRVTGLRGGVCGASARGMVSTARREGTCLLPRPGMTAYRGCRVPGRG